MSETQTVYHLHGDINPAVNLQRRSEQNILKFSRDGFRLNYLQNDSNIKIFAKSSKPVARVGGRVIINQLQKILVKILAMNTD